MSPHGTRSRYVNRGCRCIPCVDANRLAQMERGARIKADPGLAEHGLYTTYLNWRCRCPACTDANKARCKAQYEARKARR